MASYESLEAQRERSARYRDRNALERLPDVRTLDAAIASGLASFLAAQYDSDPARIRTSRGVVLLLRHIENALMLADIDMTHQITKGRLRARLRLRDRHVRRTTL
jgi:hypothetical protein